MSRAKCLLPVSSSSFFFFKSFHLFILGCAGSSVQAFSSCGEWGLFFVVVLGLLICGGSLVSEHRLWVCGLNSCISPALEHRLNSCGTGP